MLVVLFLCPLLFINIRDSHDWGDDFAMYLMEAQNIAKGEPAGQSGFMTNPNAAMGPQAYPVGFPLLLAPVVKHFGLDFRVLNLFESLMLVVALLTGFLFLRKHFSVMSSLLMTLVIAYNPMLVSFKTEVLSDLPFWCLLNLVLCLVSYHRYSSWWMLLTGALIGFAIHVRSVGLALLLAFVLYRLVTDLRNNDLGRYIKSYGVFALACVTVWLGLRLLFPVNSSYTYLESDWLTTTANHLSYNLESINNFFHSPGLSDYYFVTSICGWGFLSFMLLGFLITIRQQGLTFPVVLTLIFVVAVISYHLGDAGIRLILPLMFCLFYFFAVGAKTMLNAVQLNHKAIAWIAGGLLLLSYIGPLHHMQAVAKQTQEGPHRPEAWELFTFMKKNGIRDVAIGFDRPRALALFSGNRSVHLSDEHLDEEIGRYRLQYVLVHQMETSEEKKRQIRNDSLRFRPVFQNSSYQLYKVQR